MNETDRMVREMEDTIMEQLVIPSLVNANTRENPDKM